MSVEYVERLEQGRATPSEQVCDALSRALRLTEVEREHLFALAGRVWSGRRMRTALTPSVRRLLEQLDGPVCVYDAVWNRLAWNRSFAVLFGDPSNIRGLDANLVWRYVTGAPSRSVAPHERSRLRAYVGDLRQASARFPDDTQVTNLVHSLRESGPMFQELWDEYDLSATFPTTKTIEHPELGTLRLDCDILALDGADLRVVIFTAPPGSATADVLALLATMGVSAIDGDLERDVDTGLVKARRR